ncbi:MAG: helix-turn-helix domain-containing protein [Alphaproteobacteria bacterium]|nr:helix-turn-helix domain-containing protein [Alphaproteobacteria bacterium]
MATGRTIERERTDAAASSAERADAAFAAEIGRLVRQGRAKRGMSRRQLAQESATSERYLAQIESGTGNPSVLVMRAVADALELPMTDLLPLSGARSAAYARMVDLLGRLPPEELPAIADLIERQTGRSAASDRGRRVALVGLRGAGKSTLGKMLADKLGCPFVELDRMVEQAYGASVPMLIEMSGLATFRRYERECLQRVVDEHDKAVIATAGGIVSNPDTYGLLLRRTHTVWVSARPDEHMSRVVKQGDFRPMAKNREAMADLVAILEARRADYARAEATLDTSGATVQQSFAKLVKLVTPWMKG